MAMKRPAASNAGEGRPKRSRAVVEKAASSQGEGTPKRSSQGAASSQGDHTDAFEGFVVNLTDPAAMLQVSSVIEQKKLGRQNTSVDWSSLLTSDGSFALRWFKKVSRRAGWNWVVRLLEDAGLEWGLEPVKVWPPQGFRAAAAAPIPVGKTPVGKTPVANTPKTRAPPKTPAASAAMPSAAASSQPQASAASGQPPPSWPQYPGLKLMISAHTARLPGTITPSEWSRSLGPEIGRGSFGVVHQVSRQGENYAVKVMSLKNKPDAIKVVCTVRVFVLNYIRT